MRLRRLSKWGAPDMSDIVASYPGSSCPSVDALVLRSHVAVWREENALTVVGPSGSRSVVTDWKIDSHELTPDGQFVLALGDDGQRGAVWKTSTGQKLLDLVGQEGRRQSLRAGLVTIQDELFALVAVRNKEVLVVSARDGRERGWIATTGMLWFHVVHIFQLDPVWLVLQGYHDGEARDWIVAVRGNDTLEDTMLLYRALVEHEGVSQWGYRLAVGPAGAGQAVTARDPEWADNEPPDDPNESFHGLEIWDLASSQVVQRLAYEGNFETYAAIGADSTKVAIAGSHIDLVDRETAVVKSVEGGTLDPYRLECARIKGDTITITKL